MYFRYWNISVAKQTTQYARQHVANDKAKLYLIYKVPVHFTQCMFK